MSTRILLAASLVVSLVRCTSEPEPSPVIDPCLDACGKLACVADVESNCQQYCDSVAAQAEELQESCPRDLINLFDCQAALNCTDYSNWYDEVPGAPCLDEQAIVEASCPGVSLR